MDDFALLEQSYDTTLKLKVYTFVLLTELGIEIHPTNMHFNPILISEHMGMLYARRHAGGTVHSPYREAQNHRGNRKDTVVHSNRTQALGQRKDPCLPRGEGTIPTYGLMDIPVAKFFLREMHEVVKSAFEDMVRYFAGNTTAQARYRVVEKERRKKTRTKEGTLKYIGSTMGLQSYPPVIYSGVR